MNADQALALRRGDRVLADYQDARRGTVKYAGRYGSPARLCVIVEWDAPHEPEDRFVFDVRDLLKLEEPDQAALAAMQRAEQEERRTCQWCGKPSKDGTGFCAACGDRRHEYEEDVR